MDETEHYSQLAKKVPAEAWDATIPILVRKGSTLAMHGTGTLFAVGEDAFVITAGHVLTMAKEAGTALYAATPKNDFVQLSGDWMYSVDSECDGILDVASLLLAKSLKDRFLGASFLRLNDVLFDFEEQHAAYCIFGFPAIWGQSSTETSTTLVSKGFQYTTYAYEGSSSSLEGYNSRFHLLLSGSLDEARDEHAKPVQFTYRNGISARFPGDLGGISGCSVWRIGDLRLQLDEWAGIEPRVVGVQTCVYHKKGAIRATRWNAAATMLYKSYPQTRPAFGLHGIK